MNERIRDFSWIRYKATDSQLEAREQDYERALKIASLAEKWRQLKTKEAFAELETALDSHWNDRSTGRPGFGLWMFVDNATSANIYGSLEDCLEAAAEIMNLDYAAEILPGNLLDQIKSDCLIHKKYKYADFAIFLENK